MGLAGGSGGAVRVGGTSTAAGFGVVGSTGLDTASIVAAIGFSSLWLGESGFNFETASRSSSSGAGKGAETAVFAMVDYLLVAKVQRNPTSKTGDPPAGPRGPVGRQSAFLGSQNGCGLGAFTESDRDSRRVLARWAVAVA